MYLIPFFNSKFDRNSPNSCNDKRKDMEEIIIFEDCDNGIYLNIHPEDPDEENIALVFKSDEKNEGVGNYILESVKHILDAELCNKMKITITYEPIKED